MASNDLSRLVEELNENFGKESENSNEDSQADDVADVDLTGLDDDEVLAESKKVSMFCRNCLSPYVGQRGQGGSIILKCEKCYHRDVVTEDDLLETAPEHSESLAKGGNIILNRFAKVLLEKNELQNIDVDNPNFMDDEFQEISQTLPQITGIMKQTFSDMHKVTDDHRKVHNAEMLQMLAQQGHGEEVESEDGLKALKFSVPIHGSEEDDDLVILPEKYMLPEEAIENLQMTGRKGIQKADKYVLNIGFKMEQLQTMPLFQKRLLSYCRFAESVKRGTRHNRSDAVISKNQLQSCPESKVNDIEDKLCNGRIIDNSSERRSQQSNRPQEPNCLRMTEASAENTSILENLDLTLESELDLVNASTHIAQNSNGCVCPQNQETKTSDSNAIKVERQEQKETQSLSANTEHINDLQSGDWSNTSNAANESDVTDSGCKPKVRSENNDFSSDTNEGPDSEPEGEILPELREFSEILQSVEKQKKLANDIPSDSVVFMKTESFSHVEANEAFNEITRSLITRATVAKQQRMLSTMAMIKRAARSMSEQVDQVQDEMLKELQIAYRSKKIKADKQKKRLEETQETLEHYRELIAHYQQTGEVDKLLEIYQLLREYNNMN